MGVYTPNLLYIIPQNCFFLKGELHEKLLSIIFHLLFIFSVTIYFEGGWRILSLSHSQLAQATEMLYMRLDTMNTTCVDR